MSTDAMGPIAPAAGAASIPPNAEPIGEDPAEHPRHAWFDALLARASGAAPIPTAVAHPCDAHALGAAVEAAKAGLIVPILVGPETRILRAAAEAKPTSPPTAWFPPRTATRPRRRPWRWCAPAKPAC